MARAYSMRLILPVLLLIPSLVSATQEQQPKGTVGVLTVEAAVTEALRNNPRLSAQRAHAEAKARLPSQRGALPDPSLSLNALNLPTDSFALGQEPMTQLQVGLSQKFPFPGKLGLRRRIAERESEASNEQASEVRVQLIKDVKIAWWQLFFLDRALETVQTNQELLRQFLEIAGTKYETGQGLQQDVLLAQLELSRLLDRELTLQGKRRVAEALLGEFMDRPGGAVLRLPSTADDRLQSLPPQKTLYEKARTARPLLAQQLRLQEAARGRLDLSKKDYMPDFKLGVAYGFRQGENLDGSARSDFASVMLSLNLPLYAGSKQSQAEKQRVHELFAAKDELREAHARVRAAVSQAMADFRRAREQVALFKNGIIPQARQTVASMLAGYQVDKVDFLNLVRSQITLYDYETQYWQALSEAEQALAKIAAAIGAENLDE